MARIIPFARMPAGAPEPIELDAAELEFVGETQVAAELPSTLLEEDVDLHSFSEHRAALDGPAFDPVHLLLRSQIQALAEDDEEPIVASIIKARHDLNFWGPMVELGLGGAFSGHLGDLYEDLELLERFPARTSALRCEWEDARAAILGALPSRARRAA